jgi:2-oxoglutarate dehydrogenase E2 component (dihydrolipoamide succinyltransferase)
MAVEVKIPPMGESITGGLLAAWLVKSGDAVRKGQALFSYETDKVTSEGTAEVDGKITIAVEAGTEVLVNQVVASIEAGAAGNASSAPAPATPATKAAPTAAPAADRKPRPSPPNLVPPPKVLPPYAVSPPKPDLILLASKVPAKPVA